MKLIPKLPLFTYHEVESKVCLIHTLSDTIIYIHKAGDEIPEELDRESKCLIIKSPDDSDLNIAYVTYIQSSKSKKECLNIIEEAWDWYKNHLTISQLLQGSKLINI